ncbi:hypothetical protein [Microbacterium sp. KR10-403]|uniref:hypothetical protein n=1 Tax=Microbacterium sp. KR10-403 TaxID=3158581 RepID=UPI0032E4286C
MRARGPRLSLQGARIVTAPADAVDELVDAADHAFDQQHFRVRRRPDVAGVRALYRRGSTAEDLTLFASGIETLVHRIGPFSALGVIVLWIDDAPDDAGRVRAVLSMIRGYDLRREFTTAAASLIADLADRGMAIQDLGWQHAVLLADDCPANPRTARRIGLR